MVKDDLLKVIQDYPDISFIDNYTVDRLEEEMIGWFKEKKKELTGETVSLGMADDRRILLQTGAYFIFQGYMFADNAGKMGLLKYSYGEFLENLGALKHVYRKAAQRASVTIRFSLYEARNAATGIPQGTRLTSGDGVYFATDQYAEIMPGEGHTDVGATCLLAGKEGNHYGIGEIKTIVDPIPFIDFAENITIPENGADMESDESLKERIYAAPAAYSSAGTKDAYEYFAKKFSPEVADVNITSPEPCKVLVCYLLEDGQIPGTESVKAMQNYLSSPLIRPVTDQVEVRAPELERYSIQIKYFINASDGIRANMIQQEVEKAIEGYQIWQRSRMGRDVNPSELVHRMIAAGAKRVEVSKPLFRVIPEGSVAHLEDTEVIYGGLEDD